ncbi:tetratricopeptide repeat protein [Edaphobacter paludis]|uniref:Tetratricopeptide repeat protein n=1 Tax=Edaphobacter paludis TaxID=3035702 RepID=A0AAU7D8Z8_9BACT
MNSQSPKILRFVSLAASYLLDACAVRSSKAPADGRLGGMLPAVLALMIVLLPAAFAQKASLNRGATIQGTVSSSDGKPVSDAVIRLERKGSANPVETKSNAAGAFEFSALSVGSYQLIAEKSGFYSHSADVTASSESDLEKVDFVLQVSALTANSRSAPGPQTMQFADKPNFTVAGVTDWTAVGGHGSDSTLRTSESLANETATLKPQSSDPGAANALATRDEREAESRLSSSLASAPGSFDANHRLGELYLHAGKYGDAIPLLESAYRIDPENDQNRYDLALACEGTGDLSKAQRRIQELLAKRESANLHRLMGEVDEKLGDPLSAVHEYEQAVKLSPSEQNYFGWGSELLLHRAVWQAQEVFRKGVEAYPKSARMQTALGTALFAGARYDEAALHLCAASDLNPEDPSPYIFMGKVQIAAPNTLACVQPKLARFVQQQPGSSIANYLYAMSLLKHEEQSPDKQAVQQAQVLLTKAVTLDPKCSEAYLQLGILAASQRNFDQAIGFYSKAIEADPQLADAHYRLGVAYDRTGQTAKAKQELQLHDQIKRQQAQATERQRREIKQFLIVQQGEPASSVAK